MTEYRIWPGAIDFTPEFTSSADNFRLAHEFYVTGSGIDLTAIHFNRPDDRDGISNFCGLYEHTSGDGTSSSHWTELDIGGINAIIPEGTGWQTYTLDSPVALTANTRYRASVTVVDGFIDDSGYWVTDGGEGGEADKSNGPLIMPTADNALGTAQGSFDQNADAAPVSTNAAKSNYSIDVTVDDPAVLLSGSATLQTSASATFDVGGVITFSGSATLQTSASALLRVVNPFRDAIEARNRKPVLLLEADWDRDGTFGHALSDLTSVSDSVDVERSITSAIPDEASLVEGHAAAELTATLSGRLGDSGLDVAEIFAPYRTDSTLSGVKLIGVPIRCDMGMRTEEGSETVRQFTGFVRSLAPVSGSRTVELVGIDGGGLLHKQITLPQWSLGGFQSHYLGANGFGLFARAQWPIDYILRQNGIFASPPFRGEAFLATTCHGAMAPEIGQGGSSSTALGTPTIPDEDYDVWIDGPSQFGMLAPNGTTSEDAFYQQTSLFSLDTIALEDGTGIGLSMWVLAGNGMELRDTAGLTVPRQIWAVFGEETVADIRLEWAINGSSEDIPRIIVAVEGQTDVTMDGPPLGSLVEWRFFGVHLGFASGQITATWRLNGTTTTDSAVAWTAPTDFPRACASATLYIIRPMTNFQMWEDASAPPSGEWQGESHTSQVSVIDEGNNRLAYLPRTLRVDSWTLLQEIAAAEAGLVGFDEDGRFFFHARGESLVSGGTPVRVLSTEKELKDLATEISLDSVRNSVAITTSPRYVTGNWAALVYKSDDITEFETPGNTTSDFDLALPEYVQTLVSGDIGTSETTAQFEEYEDEGFPGRLHYVVTKASDGSGGVSEDVEVWVVRKTLTRAVLSVRNGNDFAVRLATNPAVSASGDSEPALYFALQAVTEAPADTYEITDQASVDAYGPAGFTLGDSDWVQVVSSLSDVADQLLVELAEPRPVLDEITAVGDPRRTVNEVVEITDKRGLGTTDATIIGVKRTLSADSGLEDSYTLRALE